MHELRRYTYSTNKQQFLCSINISFSSGFQVSSSQDGFLRSMKEKNSKVSFMKMPMIFPQELVMTSHPGSSAVFSQPEHKHFIAYKRQVLRELLEDHFARKHHAM